MGQDAEPSVDLLASGSDESPAGQRFRGAVDRSGVIGWARRHRMLLLGVGAVMAVVAAVAGYMVTRPPAVNPVVAIDIVGFSDSGGEGVDDGSGVIARRYQATVRAAGDVDTLVGVIGPGLGNPTSTLSKVRFGLPQVGTLGATLDCSGAGWWDATDVDYRARVSRTDRYGRQTTYDAPLGGTPQGPSNAAWHTMVRQFCFRASFQSLPPTEASGARVGDQVHVDLTVTNPSRHALWVAAPDYSDGLVEMRQGEWTELPARGDAVLRISIGVVDCAHGVPGVPLATTPLGGVENAKALPVYVSDQATPVEGPLVGVWMRLEPASISRLDRQIAALC
jgi:hypothetical protein